MLAQHSCLQRDLFLVLQPLPVSADLEVATCCDAGQARGSVHRERPRSTTRLFQCDFLQRRPVSCLKRNIALSDVL